MASGTVKWFNGQKGYGFIQPDTGGKDVFVHISAVEKAGMDGLPDGAKITYDIISDRGKESAGNLLLKWGRPVHAGGGIFFGRNAGPGSTGASILAFICK
jgi:CspA family cold shock protein